MKKALKKEAEAFHFVNGKKIYGFHSDVCNDLTGVRGDLTGVRGNLTGVWGDLTGVWGDLDECEISDSDRKKGVNIEDLILNGGD